MAHKWDSVFLVGCGFLLYGVTFGTTRSLGVYFIHFQTQLGATASQASLSVSITPSVMYVLGPLWGFVYNTIGERRTAFLGTILWTSGMILISFAPTVLALQFFLACLAGPGVGLLQLAVFSMIGRGISANRSLANNIMAASISCWSFSMSPLMQFFIEEYGWRGSLLIVSGVVSNCIPFGMLITSFYFKVMSLKEKKDVLAAKTGQIDDGASVIEDLHGCCELQEIGAEAPVVDVIHGHNEAVQENDFSNISRISSSPTTPRDETIKKNRSYKCPTFLETLLDKDLVLDWCFLTYCTATACYVLCLMTNAIYLVRIAQSIGIDDSSAVWIASIQQIMNVVVSPLSGYFTSYDEKRKNNETKLGCRRSLPRLRRSPLQVIFMITYSIAFLVPTIFTSISGLIAYVVISGIVQGLISGMPYTVLADLFGTKKLPSALGIRSLFVGVTLLIVPPITGSIVDATKDYLVVMYIASGTLLFAAFLFALAQYGVTRRSRVKSVLHGTS